MSGNTRRENIINDKIIHFESRKTSAENRVRTALLKYFEEHMHGRRT